MERELQQKTVEWAAIVEFFTKRGRPLSKDEIQKLVDEDRKAREVEEARKRAEELRMEQQRRMSSIQELLKEGGWALHGTSSYVSCTRWWQ